MEHEDLVGLAAVRLRHHYRRRLLTDNARLTYALCQGPETAITAWDCTSAGRLWTDLADLSLR